MSIEQQFFDAELRAEKIIHLGTQCWDDSAWPDDAQDVFDSDLEKVMRALGIDEPEEGFSGIADMEEFLRLHKKNGFLVLFATPVPFNITADSYTAGWGWYATQWIYADDYSAACNEAIEWQADYIVNQRIKALGGES